MAMSVSRMRDSDAARFSVATLRLAIVDSKRFWTAPRPPRVVETEAMAESRAVMAVEAALTTSSEPTPRPVALTVARVTLMVSPALEPTWNTPPVPDAAVPVPAKWRAVASPVGPSASTMFEPDATAALKLRAKPAPTVVESTVTLLARAAWATVPPLRAVEMADCRCAASEAPL